MKTRRARRRGESGFALLLVFAMAAAVAIMLYMEVPRVAFEAQRNKEQLLIERGEQYKRAIQLYFRKFKQYPPSIDRLENTNNIRFLRRRYPDPLTGKDEWRLIHVGPGGVFTDSLTQKPKTDPTKQQPQNSDNFITQGPAIGSTLADMRRPSAFAPRRPSEGGQPATPSTNPGVAVAAPPPPAEENSGDTEPAESESGDTPAPQPAESPGAPLNGAPGSPFAPVPFSPGAQPGQPPTPGAPGTPGGPVPVFPGVPTTPMNPVAAQPGSVSVDPTAMTPGSV